MKPEDGTNAAPLPTDQLMSTVVLGPQSIPEQKPMPPEIAEAILDVMGKLDKITKQHKSDHGNYKFASIDDFLAAVMKPCAEAGLIITTQELSATVSDKPGSKSGIIEICFGFRVYHKSGTQLPETITRTVMVPWVGAQSFGMAQSYALKQFLRALFLIPTGDKEDADYSKPEDAPKTRTSSRRQDTSKTADKPAPKTAEPGTLSTPTDDDGWRKWASGLLKEANNCKSEAAYNDWRQDDATITRLKALKDGSPEWFGTLTAKVQIKLKELQAQTAANADAAKPAGGDPQSQPDVPGMAGNLDDGGDGGKDPFGLPSIDPGGSGQ